MAEQNDISINQWLDKLLAKGVYGFAKEALKPQMPGYSVIAVKRARISRFENNATNVQWLINKRFCRIKSESKTSN